MLAPKWYRPVEINQVVTLCDYRPKNPPANPPQAKTAK